MKQQINLYQEILRPKNIRWSSNQLVKIITVTIFLMFLIDAFGYWQTWQSNQELLQIKKLVKKKQAELKKVEVEYPLPIEDQRLRERVSKLGDELRLKKNIVGLLKKNEYGMITGFSDYLTGLAKQHVTGTWLTHISITQGGKQMSLAGSSLKPELVPKLLRKLGKEPGFAGKEFNVISHRE